MPPRRSPEGYASGSLNEQTTLLSIPLLHHALGHDPRLGPSWRPDEGRGAVRSLAHHHLSGRAAQ